MSRTPSGWGGQGLGWDDAWAEGGHHDGSSNGWAHHDIVVNAAGEVITFHEQRPEVLVLDPGGALLRSFPVDLVEGHGMTLVAEKGEEFLWIADNGSKNRRGEDGAYSRSGSAPVRGTVAKYALDGREVVRLETPDLAMYRDGSYSPTKVAVDEERLDGSGDVWVADGYGQSVVHRFNSRGELLATIDGAEGAGRFDQPHAVFIDRRSPAPQLYIADRGNKRIQVYDLSGGFVRSFGEDFLVSPSGFAPYGRDVLVAELDSRLAVIGPDDELVTYIGTTGTAPRERPGWPNVLVDGKPERPPLPPEAFNTPHGIAVDAHGNVYVSEWLIGGRLVRLEPRGEDFR